MKQDFRIAHKGLAAALLSLVLGGAAQSAQAQISITPSGGSTRVTESGLKDHYSVVLSTKPVADVHVSLGGGEQLQTDKSNLVFTPDNHATPQSVTVSAINDRTPEGTHTGTVSHNLLSADASYNGSRATLEVSIADNDQGDVEISESGGGTEVAEGGATDSYAITLSMQPNADVIVEITPDSQRTTLTEIVVSPARLSFTPANYRQPQTVTVKAVDDGGIEGAHSDLLRHRVSSGDSVYNLLPVDDVAVRISDNDLAGIILRQSAGATKVVEGGAEDSYSVVLSAAPLAPVTVSMTTDRQLRVTPPSLNFTSSNYNRPQIVTVSAVDDVSGEGAHAGTISHQVSGDPGYQGQGLAPLTVLIGDNDGVNIMVNESDGATQVVEGQSVDSYSIRLTTRPAAEVSVVLTFDAQLSVSPSQLIFTAADYAQPKTITVSAPPDTLEGERHGLIRHSAESNDPVYHGIEMAEVSVIIQDSKAASTEGSSGSADSALPVVIPPASSGGNQAAPVASDGGSGGGAFSWWSLLGLLAISPLTLCVKRDLG